MDKKTFFRLTVEEQWRAIVANLQAAEEGTVYARAKADDQAEQFEAEKVAFVKLLNQATDELAETKAELASALEAIDALVDGNSAP